MKPQFITTANGEELIILPRAAYDVLIADAKAAAEDRQDSRLAAEAEADLSAGRTIRVPLDVAERILDGENRLRALRKWRGLTQSALGKRAGLAQSAISALEKGESEGTLSVWRDLAQALDLPFHLLVEQAHASPPS